jgi:hypothetical protein
MYTLIFLDNLAHCMNTWVIEFKPYTNQGYVNPLLCGE